ncbi:MAG: pseudouridine-5'-phosphate glycosidase [FCB group bacterium]|nr:pseudouridine-5'-phosphate glycosidase [FCB group bacterium]MBL7029459.1 pseudouridine-5'-phosphate glycosidase [Candidatus Neomarinimicrobiota bacterium]MBL7121481.1 pseudouridine-5'-phosphate glycosidase [Candidatus Neomarinimicrobiota bacterium]
MNKTFNYSKDVQAALSSGHPVLALESTIIAHGMPYPQNLEFAWEAEQTARKYGAIPATVAILNGEVCIGLDENQLEILASDKNVKKVATREIGGTLATGGHGATTVSSTMRLAHQADIRVFATGGIGGVHRGAEKDLDISADLIELSRTPVIVISAGAKAILDLPKTLEYLETMSVPVIGFGTTDFPAFYSSRSGLEIHQSMNSPAEISSAFDAQCSLGIHSGMLIANPAPPEIEIPLDEMSVIIDMALKDAARLGIIGKELTPYLLGRIVELTEGRSLVTNRILALNNAELGAKIAVSLAERA